MKGIVVGAWLLLALIAPADAGDCIKDQYGNVVCGGGQCATDQYGKVLCAKAGGGAVKDRFGVVKCGIGFCATDDNGQVKCSTQAGGAPGIRGCAPGEGQLSSSTLVIRVTSY